MSCPHPRARSRSRALARAAVIAALAGLPLLAAMPSAYAQPADEPTAAPTATPTGVPTVVLTKTYQPRNPDPAPGEAITYTASLTNESAADATGYVIEGLIPPQVVDVTWNCTATGAGSACGVDSGVGDLHDTADVGAGGTVVYVLEGTIAPDWEGTFVQAVTLLPGPGQLCEPVFVDGPPGTPEQDAGSSYPYPPAAEELLCRVNNRVNPQALPVSPPEGEPGTPQGPGVPPVPEIAQPPAAPPGLPETGTPLALYTVGGLAATALGASLVWFARRRSGAGSPTR